MNHPVLILGAGVLGKTAADIFNANQVLIYGFLDDDKTKIGQELLDIVILGETDDDGFLKLIGQKTEAFIAVDHVSDRKALVKMLMERRKVMPVNAIHPRAVVSTDSSLGHGTLIASGVIINPQVRIGHHAVILSGAILEPDVVIEDYVHIGAGACINSGVVIEEGAFIGPGAVLIAGITVGKNARIGAGSVVIADVAAKATVFGNPAAVVKK